MAETHFKSGDPDKEILRTAEAVDVGAISGALPGSVSDWVVRQAHCPVFVVRK